MTNSVWTVDSWSVYGRSIRTNNDCEGWHNRRAKKGNLPFYFTCNVAIPRGERRQFTDRLVKEKKLRRHQTKQTKKIQGRLWKGLGAIQDEDIND